MQCRVLQASATGFHEHFVRRDSATQRRRLSGGVPFDHAVQALANMLAAHANLPDFGIDTNDIPTQAGGSCANGFAVRW